MRPMQGEHIYLRAIEPEDLEFIHEIENDHAFWDISNTIVPYSKFVIKQYIEHSHKDIYEVKQLRLVICNYQDEAIGMIDLFDFDFKNKRAGIGILIKEETNRQKGFGRDALRLLIAYCKSQLALHQLYCNISEGNNLSLKLFKNEGFEIIGLKKDWNYINGAFKNEYLLQILL
ncbi:GNAT family N-acetyltransferase [Psychroserpens sp.]|uniref:GNAT family N-acetyltransferase n=1 Tax=Psychroserpens sp. TaxID=2020870 RepID=UPI001B0E26F7|nr:GNAT family N-acetyltransferase [Psychroserpens sp.]MBO6606827.1 GNAT family N-acetyltransferase [Psychroserpens sp.]MBO6653530.1 GNAT family N-acetyltransferase [Psychroserpens sp.]MBO6680442.1 GNAT family N-acetyltransferase [Psychroserpens sp.]MBO6750599.1 GNAT family N-acetyltransferase [Psychroserpens sp.]MBO6915082.1 GNAT family N-acetyltransferase [Psychroserpens sp.]